MTTHRPALAPAAARPRRRIPAFSPIPLRARADGWTPLRQAEFIGHLAETGSVRAAAAAVGKSRESAYKLRRKPGAESFAIAWDVATGALAEAPRRKFTSEELWQRVDQGLWKPRFDHGKFVAVVRKADNSALLALLGRIDRAAARGRE